MVKRRVWPANMNTARRHLKISGQFDLHTLRINHGAGRGLDNFLNRLHASPDTGIATHGKGMQSQVKNFLYAGRKKHGQPAGLENMVALVRSR